MRLTNEKEDKMPNRTQDEFPTVCERIHCAYQFRCKQQKKNAAKWNEPPQLYTVERAIKVVID